MPPYPVVLVMRPCACGKPRTYGSGSRHCDACTSSKERAYVSSLQRKYGLSSEDYYLLVAKQEGRCFICGRLPGKRRLAVDHCHATGRVRGLLCMDCNQFIGHIKDSVEAARRVVDYLT
jgi:hypothetical protein